MGTDLDKMMYKGEAMRIVHMSMKLQIATHVD